MANTPVKISQLPSYTTPQAADVFPIVQTSTDITKKVAASIMKSFFNTAVVLTVGVSGSNAQYVGNGINDDAAINAAVAAAISAGGGTVQLGPGTFHLSQPVALNASNLRLIGVGMSSVLFVNNNANIQAAVSITGTGTTNCEVSELFIQGNTNNQSFGDGIYIKTPWSGVDGEHIIENVTIYSCKNNGIEWGVNGDTRVTRLRNVKVTGCGGNNYYMPWPSMTDSEFLACTSDLAGLNGFYVGGLNNHFTDCKSFYNGVSGAGNYGFYVNGYNNYFLNCEAQDNYVGGLYSTNGGDPTYGTQRNMLINFIADSNNQLGISGDGCGVRLVNCNNWTIIGGEFFTRPYPSFTQRIGISLEGTTTGCIMVGVKGTGNSSSLVSDTSSGFNPKVMVEGNLSNDPYSSANNTLTDAATIATNAVVGNLFSVTIAASRTMGAPTNPTGGQKITYRITQGGSGSNTITWNSAFSFGAAGAPTLSTAVGKTDYVVFMYNSTAAKWQYQYSSLGF